MSHEAIKQSITDAEKRIEAVKAGANLPKKERASLADLKVTKKKLERERRAAFLDEVRRAELKKEIGQVDATIALIESDVRVEEERIAELKLHFSEHSVLERKRAAIQAGDRISQRLNEELPPLADRTTAAMLEVEKCFTELDKIARANGLDFHAMARIAYENSDEDAAQRVMRTFERALALRIDAVLAHFLVRIGAQYRSDFVEIARPQGGEVSLFVQLEHWSDGLLAKLAELRQRIEEQPEEEKEAA